MLPTTASSPPNHLQRINFLKLIFFLWAFSNNNGNNDDHKRGGGGKI